MLFRQNLLLDSPRLYQTGPILCDWESEEGMIAAGCETDARSCRQRTHTAQSCLTSRCFPKFNSVRFYQIIICYSDWISSKGTLAETPQVPYPCPRMTWVGTRVTASAALHAEGYHLVFHFRIWLYSNISGRDGFFLVWDGPPPGNLNRAERRLSFNTFYWHWDLMRHLPWCWQGQY